MFKSVRKTPKKNPLRQARMADRSTTRTATKILNELSKRTLANELAKKTEIWFNKFLKDIPELDDEFNKCSVWIYSIKNVCKKQNCFDAPNMPPIPN